MPNGPRQPSDAAQATRNRAETVSALEAEIAQLRQAVHSHAVINQALGVIVTIGGVTPEEAWDILRETSMGTNIKLRQVAEALITWVHSGDLSAEIRDVLSVKLHHRTTGDPTKVFRLISSR